MVCRSNCSHVASRASDTRTPVKIMNSSIRADAV
jgi:hypothetical protein